GDGRSETESGSHGIFPAASRGSRTRCPGPRGRRLQGIGAEALVGEVELRARADTEHRTEAKPFRPSHGTESNGVTPQPWKRASSAVPRTRRRTRCRSRTR